MGLAQTVKQVYEKFFIHGDFSAVMDVGETIASANASAVDKNLEDATVDVIEAETDYSDGSKHYIRLQNGSIDLQPYVYTIRITTSKGNQWKVDGALVIK